MVTMKEWERFLKRQEQELGKASVEKWLRSLIVQNFDAQNLYLIAQDPFQKLWFDEHIKTKAQAQLINNNGRPIKIHLTLENAQEKKKKKGTTKQRKNKNYGTVTFKLELEKLNPYYTFDTFISDTNNQVTIKLLHEVIEGTNTFNPIYIYSPKGCGKTHLLMATAHKLLEKGVNALFNRADTFTHHVVSAIRSSEMSTFRQTYRHIDVLLIDDVERFGRKAATQEELFHTFNTLHLMGKQIILTGNSLPKELSYIEPRLISRFEWGITLPLEPLDKSFFSQLVEQRLKALQFPLSDEVSEYIINTFSTPFNIIKAIEALCLRSHLESKPTFNLLEAKTILKPLTEEEKSRHITPEKVLETVAAYYGIPVEEVLGKSQSRECVTPRKIAMHICRQNLKLPFMRIGEMFSRDHSTVISSVKQIEQKLKNNSQLKHTYQRILKKIHLCKINDSNEGV